MRAERIRGRPPDALYFAEGSLIFPLGGIDMEKVEAKHPSRVKAPMDKRPAEPAAESGAEYCVKAFNAETARLEDADEPCLNGEG